MSITAPSPADLVEGIPADSHLRTEVTAGLVPGTPTEVAVRARQHEFTIDEPPALGGTDKGANPVEHLLAALGACNVITYQVWAEKLGLRIDTVDVRLVGDIDLRGFLGLEASVRPGFQGVALEVTLGGPEPAEAYAELHRQVEAHCPVFDNLTAGVPVEVRIQSS